MDFFIKEENVRPGNRGGRDQFKWDNIRLLNNKDRESYLGVTQSIGFLDKGGKWRRRDWWRSHEPEKLGDKDKIQAEKEDVKKEEERLFMEMLNPGKDKSKVNTTTATANQTNTVNKLTDYEWKELMKKEANLAPDDTRLYEFYENDEHKAGVGMKQTVSFRTNPYEDKKGIIRLEGNVHQSDSKPDQIDDFESNPYLKDTKHDTKSKTIVNKYINAYLNDKKKNPQENILEANKTKLNEKITKKEKKEKKSKRNKSRSRSRSRRRKPSRSRSRSRSQRKDKHRRK